MKPRAADFRRYVCSMNPKIILTTISAIILPALIAGCSWVTDFVITNTSSGNLFVSYTVNGKTCPDDNFIIIPATKMTTELKKEQGEWKRLSTDKYSCDANTRVVKTVLPPNMALRVARIGTFTGERSYGKEDFEVLRLELKGAEGDIHLNGLKVLKAFKYESKTLYVLNY